MDQCKLSVKAVALTSSVLWGACVLIVGICNVFWPDYGTDFLLVLSSLYPGYQAMPEVVSVLIGTAWALLDGALCGLLVAVIYNAFAGCCGCCSKEKTKP